MSDNEPTGPVITTVNVEDLLLLAPDAQNQLELKLILTDTDGISYPLTFQAGALRELARIFREIRAKWPDALSDH